MTSVKKMYKRILHS